jgi:hypothetical protein
LFLPNRANDRRRLYAGAALVALTGLANLIPISFGVLGSPWPLGLVWAACGWLSLGPNAVVVILLLGLGLLLDLVTGSPLGAWAFCGLATYALGLAQRRWLTRLDVEGLPQIAASCFYMTLACLFVGLILGSIWAVFGLILPLAGAVFLYALIAPMFVFEDQK